MEKAKIFLLGMATALGLGGEYGLSLRDSCIVAAAQKAGVRRLWSTAMKAGRCLEAGI